MGVAIYIEKCWQCGGELLVYEDNKLHDITAECLRCGMKYANLQLPQEYYDEMAVEDAYEEIDYEDHWKEKGYGVACIVLKDGCVTRERIEFPYEEKKINEYLALLESDEVDADESYLTLWDEKNQKVISIFGSMPPSYDESDFNKE